jgi:hypothetical protein
MKKTSIVRIVEFDKLVRGGKYPNRNNFSVDYEVSDRTVARDIEYLRDMLGAPLEYNRDRNGYYYSEPWNLPAVVTLSSTREDRINLLIEELKGMNCSEREFVFRTIGLYNNPISSCESQEEPFHQAVA